MAATLNIDMPGVDFAGMAREAISAKLTEALVGNEQAITAIVAAALTAKVNSQGQIDSRYSYDNKTPYVEWLAQDCIRAATKQVIDAKVAALKPAIAAGIEKQLQKSVKSIAIALTESFIRNATHGYGVKFEVNASFLPPAD